MAWSTRLIRSAARRSPEPMRRSSRDCGHVVERAGMDGVAVPFDFELDARGSHKS